MRQTVRFILLAIVLALAMGQSQCARDYTNPSPPTPAPAGTPATHKYREKVPQNPPDPLNCDVPVYQTIALSETGVTCEPTFNYSTLFKEAKALAEGIKEATRCPNNCKPAHMWIERLTTTCQGTTAGVILEIGLLCPRTAPRPPGLQTAATDPALNGAPVEQPNPQPPAKPSIGDVTGKVATTPVTCTPVEYVEYKYLERAACAPPFNYKPYVDRAERRAGAVCKAVNCAAGCAACVPPVLARTQWGCRNGNEVEVTIDVQCCK